MDCIFLEGPKDLAGAEFVGSSSKPAVYRLVGETFSVASVCQTQRNYYYLYHLTTYIIGDVVIKLLRDEVIQTHNLYAILIPN